MGRLTEAARILRRAPAFNLRHDVIFAAGRALARPLDKGDNEASPTRRGLLYINDLTLLPAEYFRWLPAAEANIISFDASKRSFACAAALRVEGPDGVGRDLPLRPNAGCSSILPVAADVVLLDSVPGPAKSAAPGAPRAGGLTLLSASASARGQNTALTVEWRIETAPRATIAFIPRLKDDSGGLLLDAVFPSRGGGRPYPMIWPLVDDLAPGLALTPGRTLRETFLLRKALGPASSATLELDAYEIAPAGGAVPLGTVTVPVSLKR